MECHHVLRDRLLVDFIVTYENDLDEESWKGVAEMLSSESTPLVEKLLFLQALFPSLESKFHGEREAMERFVVELVEITQQVVQSSEVSWKDMDREGEGKEKAKPSSSSSSSSSPSSSVIKETLNEKQLTYAKCLKIFEGYGIHDSEMDEETLEYLVDVLGNEVDQADRLDQLELLQMYLPGTEIQNQEDLLDDMIALSQQAIQQRVQIAVGEASTSPSSSPLVLSTLGKEKDSDSTEQAWMASEENKDCKKSILQMYNKEFITGYH